MIGLDPDGRKQLRKAGVWIFLLVTAAGGIKNYFYTSAAAEQIAIAYAPDPAIEEPASPAPEAAALQPEEAVVEVQTVQASSENGLISINQADQQALETLKGIGPAKAIRIIQYREAYGGFKQLEEIMEVKGIGPVTFEKIRNNICL